MGRCERDTVNLKSKVSEPCPELIFGQRIVEASALDEVKYILADDAWLLICSARTEPILRVYTEGPTYEDVEALLAYGEEMAGL